MTLTFQTTRCFIEPLKETDRNSFFEICTNVDVRRHLGGPVDKTSLETKFSETLKSKDDIHWTVRSKNNHAFIGLISIDKHHDGEDYEISYQFLPDYWGQGLASETLETCIEKACQTLQISSLVAETQTSNLRSIKLLDKLGMIKEKTVMRCNEHQTIFRYKKQD